MNNICASTQFLQIQKNQFFDHQETLERFCKVLSVLCFNSAKFDLNLIKSYFVSILVNERHIEPAITKRANHFFSFILGYLQL